MKKYYDCKNFKRTYLIESFFDYFSVIQEIASIEKDKLLWYRGQSDEAWHIKPNLFRCSKEGSDYIGRRVDPLNPKLHFSNGYEVEFPDFVAQLNEFKKLVKKEFKDKTILPRNNFDWLFLGQHYGLLTPLVDFSTDPLVALYFSIEAKFKNEKQGLDECVKEFDKYGYSSDCAAVFVMLPEEVKRISGYEEKIENRSFNNIMPITSEEYSTGEFDSYVIWKKVPWTPLCIIAQKKDYRLIRQSGNFLCYGKNIQSIDYLECYKNSLYKIYIPHCLFDELNNMLTILDLTHKTIFGENLYDEVAKKCKNSSLLDFNRKMIELSKKIKQVK